MADGILFLFGGIGYLAPVALFTAGTLIVVRPMMEAVRPFKTGFACLAAALTLGLAAGSLGLGPGDTPRDGFLDPGYLRVHGGLAGETLFWTSSTLFSEAGSHILFVFLLLAGILLVTGASIAGVMMATREAATSTSERVRRGSRRSRWRRPRRCPAGARRSAGARGRGAGGAGDPRRGARARRGGAPPPVRGERRHPSPPGGRRRAHPGSADADGQSPFRRHRGRRSRLPHAESRLPQALERRPEGRHEGHRARRRTAHRGAQPLQRRGEGDRHGHRSARHALRAAPRARDQDVQGRPVEGRPRVRAGRRAGAHPGADPRQAGGGRRGAEPRAQDGASGRRVPGRAKGLVATVGLARQGHRGQGDRHRPRQAAAHPHRRHHRLGQVGLRERNALERPAALRPQRGAHGAGRPQARGAEPLRGHPAPAHAGRHLSAAGRQRARQPDQGDGGALRRDEPRQDAQPGGAEPGAPARGRAAAAATSSA